jgi:hypothetical protein
MLLGSNKIVLLLGTWSLNHLRIDVHLFSSPLLYNSQKKQFTDGIAIGVSFAQYTGKSTDTIYQIMLQSSGGLATTMSIMFHEIPHELGDFAILVKQGYSKHQAIMAQFGTAVAAMMGTYVGLMVSSIAHSRMGDELLLVTAGGFVYLASVNILPELLDESNRSWKQRLIQLVVFALGIGLLYAVSLLEEMDHHGHDHHHHHSFGHDEHLDTHHHNHDTIHEHSHPHLYSTESQDHGYHHDHGHHHDHGEL